MSTSKDQHTLQCVDLKADSASTELSPACIADRELSWEAATERMLDAAELQPGEWPNAASKVAEATLFSAYNAALGKCSMPCNGKYQFWQHVAFCFPHLCLLYANCM